MHLGEQRKLLQCPAAREQSVELGGCALVGERGIRRPPGADLPRELRGVAVGRDGDETKALRMAREHIERALADRASGTQYRDADHVMTPRSDRPRSSTGAAPVRLSMRSITPPWPGNMLPLSFMPAKRLSRLSVRSPTTEKP